jgi:hypothetical protein
VVRQCARTPVTVANRAHSGSYTGRGMATPSRTRTHLTHFGGARPAQAVYREVTHRTPAAGWQLPRALATHLKHTGGARPAYSTPEDRSYPTHESFKFSTRSHSATAFRNNEKAQATSGAVTYVNSYTRLMGTEATSPRDDVYR